MDATASPNATRPTPTIHELRQGGFRLYQVPGMKAWVYILRADGSLWWAHRHDQDDWDILPNAEVESTYQAKVTY